MSLWTVERVEFVSRELDFRSSEQGWHATTAVIADGIEIINALDLFDSEESPMQTIVCDACGISGCAGGNRVFVRRLDGGILLVPAFDEMAAGDGDLAEYGPPYFMSTRGSPLFQGAALAALAARIPFFADPDRWPPLTMREGVLLAQWGAPFRILGAFPQRPQLREALISAASHGTGREAIAALQEIVEGSCDDARPATRVAGEPVYFYLEESRLTEWAPLVQDGVVYRLALDPGVGLQPALGAA